MINIKSRKAKIYHIWEIYLSHDGIQLLGILHILYEKACVGRLVNLF